MVTPSDLASIEGFDDELSTELISSAKTYLEKEKASNLSILKKEGMDDYLLSSDFFTMDQLMVLNEKNIKIALYIIRRWGFIPPSFKQLLLLKEKNLLQGGAAR